MRRLTLVNLETLSWIAKLGSFTAAAERLHTTQPAISQRVRELEQSLGVELFHRQGRRMELTVKGRDLVTRAQPLLSGLDDLVSSVENTREASGVVRMGVGEMVTLTWFAEFMSRLKRDMPKVNYSIEVDLTVNMLHKLEAGQLDLAFAASPIHSNSIATQPIGSAQVQWMIERSIRDEARKHRQDVRELLAQHTIWCIAKPAQLHQMVLRDLKQHGITGKPLNTSDNLQCIIEVVARGAGIALLPTYALGPVQHRGTTLVPLSPRLRPSPLPFFVASHRDQRQAVLRHIIDVAVQTCNFSKSIKAPRPETGQ